MRCAQTGILPDREIARAVRSRARSRRRGRSIADQIQPASLDLRLGDKAWRVRASFLPGPATRVADKLDRLKLHEIDLADGAVLETGCVYIVPLLESLALPADDLGLGQSEELDRPARHLHPRHDRPRPGVRQDPGRLFRPALSRGQPAHLPDRRAHRLAPVADPLPRTAMRCCRKPSCRRSTRAETLVASETPNISGGGIALSIDLSRRRRPAWSAIAASTTPAWSTSTSAPRTTCSTSGSRSTITARARTRARSGRVLHPGRRARRCTCRPLYAAEMTPFDPLVGEFRVHYAGFFDPGFGHSAAGGTGSRAVLEVRSHEVPFILEHGQIVGRLVYEHMLSRPQALYGTDLGSNYQAQGLKLSKHFRAARRSAQSGKFSSRKRISLPPITLACLAG